MPSLLLILLFFSVPILHAELNNLEAKVRKSTTIAKAIVTNAHRRQLGVNILEIYKSKTLVKTFDKAEVNI